MREKYQHDRFLQLSVDRAIVLTEGAIIERIRRSGPGLLDPHLLHASLVYRDDGRRMLADLHRQYLDIGRRYQLPMLAFTDTWRAGRERVEKSGMTGKDVNADCARFLKEVIAEYGAYADQVFQGGLIGCKGDAYKPEEALSEKEAASYHAWQVEALAAAGVDFLIAVTLPSLSEAAGIATAMARTGLPYVISFVLDRSGRVLDGTSLQRAISRIDAETSPAPLFYMANCCHPTFYAAGMRGLEHEDAALLKRIIGLQANTSMRSADELEGLDHLDPEDPAAFAASMIGLHREFGTRYLGGCCGTDDRHIEALAKGIRFVSG